MRQWNSINNATRWQTLQNTRRIHDNNPLFRFKDPLMEDTWQQNIRQQENEILNDDRDQSSSSSPYEAGAIRRRGDSSSSDIGFGGMLALLTVGLVGLGVIYGLTHFTESGRTQQAELAQLSAKQRCQTPVTLNRVGGDLGKWTQIRVQWDSIAAQGSTCSATAVIRDTRSGRDIRQVKVNYSPCLTSTCEPASKNAVNLSIVN